MHSPTSSKGPASAGPFRVPALALALLAVAALTAGCKAGGGRSDAEASRGLPERLGAKPAIIEPGDDPAGEAPAGGEPGSSSSTTPGPGGGTTPTSGGGPGTTPAPGAPAFRSLLHSADPSGDAGLEAPAHNDMTSLRVEDDGVSVRLTVEFAADVPHRLADGEVMGVGVDLFRGRPESDFQVFADGSVEGWVAYLQAGEAFVRYQGTFAIGGRRLVFTLPWSAVGGRRGGTVSAFADWTRDRAVLAAAGADKAPDRGAAPFTP